MDALLAAYSSSDSECPDPCPIDAQSADVPLLDISRQCNHEHPATCGSEAGKGSSMLLENAAKRIKLTQHRIPDGNPGSLTCSTAATTSIPQSTTADGSSSCLEHAGNITTAAAAGVPTAATPAGGPQLAQPPRVRTFPHVDGNWPAIIFIAVTDHTCIKALEALTALLLQQCPAATAGASSAAPAYAATGSGAAEQPCTLSSAAGLQLWPLGTPAAAAAQDCSAAGSATSATQAEQQHCSHPGQQQQQRQEEQQQKQQEPCLAASQVTLQQPVLSRAQQDPQQHEHCMHLSLSRTVPIRHIQADSLRAAVSRQLRPFRAFPLTLSGLTCLANDNHSRTFVGIKAQVGKKHVLRMIEAVNRAFSTHGLPAFYEVPVPHVSLAWAPGDEVARLQPWLEGLNHQQIHLSVKEVICQVGKVKEVVWQAT